MENNVIENDGMLGTRKGSPAMTPSFVFLSFKSPFHRVGYSSNGGTEKDGMLGTRKGSSATALFFSNALSFESPFHRVGYSSNVKWQTIRFNLSKVELVLNLQNLGEKDKECS